LRGEHPQIDYATLTSLTPQPLIVDVRTPTEFEKGAIPGAINIPVDALRDRINELPRERELVAYCHVGMRGYIATRILKQAGYNVRNLSGGYRTYLLHQPVKLA
jgi:rhodanese-related sulfurtransferase